MVKWDHQLVINWVGHQYELSIGFIQVRLVGLGIVTLVGWVFYAEIRL